MTWAAAWALVRRFWWAVPMAGLLAALLFTRATLADVRQTLNNERAAWTAEIDRAEQQRLQIERDNAARQLAAATTFADRLAAREPIILRSTDTVRTYAQTDAGRAACLAADRVRGVDALDAALFPRDPASAGRGDPSLPADVDGAAGGR